jgi:hypothetical protein
MKTYLLCHLPVFKACLFLFILFRCKYMSFCEYGNKKIEQNDEVVEKKILRVTNTGIYVWRLFYADGMQRGDSPDT